MLDTARATYLLLAMLVLAPLAPMGGPIADRRIVDSVMVGDARSEADHGYAAHDDSAGVSGGRAFRQARGYMRYALTTFDDTEVTIECTFLPGNAPRAYDVVVEDSVVATRTLAAGSESTVVVEVRVPFMLTKGRTNIAVVLRARGGPTPSLHQLRTVQDHYEVDHTDVDHAAAPRAGARTGAPFSMPNPPGVAR